MGTGQPLTSQAVNIFRLFRFEIFFKCSPTPEITTSCYHPPRAHRNRRTDWLGWWWLAFIGHVPGTVARTRHVYFKSSLPPSKEAGTLPIVLVRKLRCRK